MKALRNIVFCFEDFSVGAASQQLLDRFLLGYPRDGQFHRLDGCGIVVHLPAHGGEIELARRVTDHGLKRGLSLEGAIFESDAIAVVWAGSGAVANDSLLKEIVAQADSGTPIFICGPLATTLENGQEILRVAAMRKVPLLAGTPIAVASRLPDFELPRGLAIKNALVVVQGKSPAAELDALEILLPMIGGRRGGESGVRRNQVLARAPLWRAGDRGDWSWPLLAAALSRSDTPQGDALKDGRTQDLVGLGLVPTLAREPRGWLLEHRDGLRSTILVLDGVVADCNFAVQSSGGATQSAQVFQPPPPENHNFSRLAAVIEDFFRTGKPPWPASRSLLEADLLATIKKAARRTGQWTEL